MMMMMILEEEQNTRFDASIRCLRHVNNRCLQQNVHSLLFSKKIETSGRSGASHFMVLEKQRMHILPQASAVYYGNVLRKHWPFTAKCALFAFISTTEARSDHTRA